MVDMPPRYLAASFNLSAPKGAVFAFIVAHTIAGVARELYEVCVRRVSG